MSANVKISGLAIEKLRSLGLDEAAIAEKQT